MSQEESRKSIQKKQQGCLQIVLSVLVFFILFLVECYLMINMHKEYLWISAVGIGILICVYFSITGILAYRANEEELMIDQYEGLQKAEKASYLMMRKYFSEMEDRLSDIEEKMGVPVEEIINAQKGIAKITISRSKENADALMNSNDKLLEKVSDFEEALQILSKDMASMNQTMLDKSMKDLILKQQETIGLIRESELSVKNEILNMNLKLSMGQPVMYQPQANYSLNRNDQLRQNEPEPVSDINPGILDDFSELEDFLGEETEQVREEVEEETVLAEVIPFNEPEVDQKISEGEEPDNFGIEETFEEEPAIEEPVIEEPVVEEPVIEEPVVEEPVIEEPTVVPTPPMPDLSDPNKIMSPDEIAALLANLGN